MQEASFYVMYAQFSDLLLDNSLIESFKMNFAKRNGTKADFLIC